MVNKHLQGLVVKILAGILLSISISAHAADEPDSVSALLNHMAMALRTTDYRGIFTYEYGGALQTLRVTHQVVDGEEQEHLEYLNGPARRVERLGSRLECLSPAEKMLRGQLPNSENLPELARYYQFSIGGNERVAGRQVVVLHVVPRDDYRFGYSLSIDELTGLPLGVITLASNRKVLERLQFASIDFIPDDSWVDAVDSTTTVKQVNWNACSQLGDPSDILWDIGWIPGGFISTGVMPDQGVGDTVMFSDGLSSFSVFVRPMEPEISAQGKAQRGATVAYMHQQMMGSVPHTITVVGEIPARTAQRIASSVKQKPIVDRAIEIPPSDTSQPSSAEVTGAEKASSESTTEPVGAAEHRNTGAGVEASSTPSAEAGQ